MLHIHMHTRPSIDFEPNTVTSLCCNSNLGVHVMMPTHASKPCLVFVPNVIWLLHPLCVVEVVLGHVCTPANQWVGCNAL